MLFFFKTIASSKLQKRSKERREQAKCAIPKLKYTSPMGIKNMGIEKTTGFSRTNEAHPSILDPHRILVRGGVMVLS